VSQTRPSAPRTAEMSALRRRPRIGSLLVPMAIAGTMSLTLGHLSTHEATVLTDATLAGATSDALPVPLPMPGGSTTDQFAGGRVPTPPQPV
jgi:hypothetical protein